MDDLIDDPMDGLPGLKCGVCGASPAYVRAAYLGPVSLAYCADCLSKGIEPYWLLISLLLPTPIDLTGYHPAIIRIIDASLTFAGKTVDDLAADTESFLVEYQAADLNEEKDDA